MSVGGMIPGAIDAREHELLERLGLDERATPEDVARTRDELQAFLAAAPKSLRGWARRQASAADEAYLLLSDPTASPGNGALPAPGARSVSRPGGSATPPIRRAISGAGPAPATAALAVAASEGVDDAAFEAMLAEVTPSMHRDRIPSRPAPASKAAAPKARPIPAATARRRAAVPAPAGSRSRVPQVLAALAGIAVLAVAVVAIYQLGATPAVTGSQSSAAPTPALDEAKVAALMGRIQADPGDTAALLELGDAFFTAEDFDTAALWLDKLVTLDPASIAGRLLLGAAQYNVGNDAEAKAQWLAVLELEADNVDAHYYLGYLYLNQAPPDYEGVQREWGEVVRLDPDSELGSWVKSHLDALASPAASPAGSETPSEAPAQSPSSDPSAAPTSDPSAAPTAVPTPAPSGSVEP